ncbi:MAG: class I SAM-dependent methyltransferase [Nanoarchaeota archaeon]
MLLGAQPLYNGHRNNFIAFLKRTTQKQRTQRHLVECLGGYSPQTQRALRAGEQVQFLNIGAGAGEEFIPSLVHWNQADGKRNIFSTIQEPNLGVAVLFFFNYVTEGLGIDQVRLVKSGKDSFSHAEPESVDMALASHVFYYLNDWETSIKNLYAALVPGGVACIPLTSEVGNLYKLRKRFFPEIHGKDPESGEDLSRLLDRLGIPHQDSLLTSEVRLTELLESDRKKEQGLDALYSFFLRADFNSLPKSVQRRVKQHMQSTAQGEEWSLTDRIIWVQKPGVYQGLRETPERARKTKVRLKDLVAFLEPALDDTLGKDLEFLPPGIRRAYTNILALDCALGYPPTKLLIMKEENAEYTDDYFHQFKFREGQDPQDIVLLDFDDPLTRGQIEFFRSEDKFAKVEPYLCWYDHQPYLEDVIDEHYRRLPSHEREGVSCVDFHRLILGIYRELDHGRICSYYGWTVLDSWSRSLYINRESLRTPRDRTPLSEAVFREFNARSPLLVPTAH